MNMHIFGAWWIVVTTWNQVVNAPFMVRAITAFATTFMAKRQSNRIKVMGLSAFTGISMDWFKGKSTGNHEFSHEMWGFLWFFP